MACCTRPKRLGLVIIRASPRPATLVIDDRRVQDSIPEFVTPSVDIFDRSIAKSIGHTRDPKELFQPKAYQSFILVNLQTIGFETAQPLPEGYAFVFMYVVSLSQ